LNIKAASEFKTKKIKMMRNLPKPRRRQWWEKLIEEQYEFFYDGNGSLDLKRVPK